MDVRLAAILLILVGIVLGGMLSGTTLCYLTFFLAGFAIVFLWRVNSGAPRGTSAALAVTILTLGTIASFLVPAWLVQLLK